MKTLKQVKKFIKDHPISTGGAMTQYKIRIKQIDDGDIYCKLHIPFWANNDSVVSGVLNFLIELRRWEYGCCSIYARKDHFIVHIFEHCWNGAS